MVGLIQVGSQAAADRYAYLPTIPFYLLVGVGTTHLFYLSRARWQRISQAIIIIVFLTVSSGLITTTQRQILLWKNDITFWGYVVLFYPWSSLVQTNIGSAYYRTGQYQKAVEHYQIALEIDPASKVYINLILAYIKLERFEDALAMHTKALEGKIDIGQKPDAFYYNLGFLYFKLNRLDEAKQALQWALEKNSDYSEAKSLLAHVQELQKQQSLQPPL
jgi:tetratricopeptide (TPR) repeat protein